MSELSVDSILASVFRSVLPFGSAIMFDAQRIQSADAMEAPKA